MIMKYKDFKNQLSKEEMKGVKGGYVINSTCCSGRLIFVAGGGNCADPDYAAAHPETCTPGSSQGACGTTLSNCGYPMAMCCGTCYTCWSA